MFKINSKKDSVNHESHKIEFFVENSIIFINFDGKTSYLRDFMSSMEGLSIIQNNFIEQLPDSIIEKVPSNLKRGSFDYAAFIIEKDFRINDLTEYDVIYYGNKSVIHTETEIIRNNRNLEKFYFGEMKTRGRRCENIMQA